MKRANTDLLNKKTDPSDAPRPDHPPHERCLLASTAENLRRGELFNSHRLQKQKKVRFQNNRDDVRLLQPVTTQLHIKRGSGAQTDR